MSAIAMRLVCGCLACLQLGALGLHFTDSLSPESDRVPHSPLCGCSACDIRYTDQGKGLQLEVEKLQCGDLTKFLGVSVANGDTCSSAVEKMMDANFGHMKIGGTFLESATCANDLKVEGVPENLLEIDHHAEVTSTAESSAPHYEPLCGCSRCNIEYTGLGLTYKTLLESVSCSYAVALLNFTFATPAMNGLPCSFGVPFFMTGKYKNKSVKEFVKSVTCPANLKIKDLPGRKALAKVAQTQDFFQRMKDQQTHSTRDGGKKAPPVEKPPFKAFKKRGNSTEDLKFRVLKHDNRGCHELTTESECISSRDGRDETDFAWEDPAGGHISSFADSPCQWCCGQSCTRTMSNSPKCEPKEWLTKVAKGSYVGFSKNGLGENNCPA